MESNYHAGCLPVLTIKLQHRKPLLVRPRLLWPSRLKIPQKHGRVLSCISELPSASCSLNDVFLWKARQAVLQTLTFFSDLPIFSMRNDQSLYSSFFLNWRIQA